MESMREDSNDNLNVEGGNTEDNKENQPQEDAKEETKEEAKDSSKRIEDLEKDISEILEEEKEMKKDIKEEQKEGRQEDHDGDTGKPEDRDEEDEKSNLYEDEVNLKDHTEGSLLTKSNKVYTDSHIRGSNDGDFLSFDQASNSKILDDQVKEYYLTNFLRNEKKQNFETTFIDSLLNGVEPKEILREDFKVNEIEGNLEGDDKLLTYESFILINYALFNEENKTVSLKQLSARFHSTDSLYALNIEENKFTELSRLRIVPQLKFKNHQFLMNSLSRGETDNVELSNKYDHFFQEGESNIQIQKEMSGKPVLFGDKIQLYHEATQRYLKAIPIDSSKVQIDSKERFLTFKLGFSKYPSKYTHFTLSQLYNKNMQSGNKTISDKDKAYLGFVDEDIEYNLIVGEEAFLFKTGIKQDMEVRKLSNPFGCQENELTQKLKYVYIRHGQGHNFIKPVFDDKFAQFKLQEIRQDEITETSGLRVDFVWKCIAHSDLKVSFVHMKSGILLSFDKSLNWADTNGERCKKRFEEVQRMINDES